MGQKPRNKNVLKCPKGRNPLRIYAIFHKKMRKILFMLFKKDYLRKKEGFKRIKAALLDCSFCFGLFFCAFRDGLGRKRSLKKAVHPHIVHRGGALKYSPLLLTMHCT